MPAVPSGMATCQTMNTSTQPHQGPLLRAIYILLAVGFLNLPARVYSSPPQYNVTDLGAFGGNPTYALSVSGFGQAVGFYLTGDGVEHAVMWTGTTPITLNGLGGSNSGGAAVNASGQVAGTSDNPGDTAFRAVRWTSGVPTDLGTLGGANSAAYAINASGQVAGFAETATPNSAHAVRWTGTTPTDLALPPGDLASYGQGINDSGQIAGYSLAGSGDSVDHAVRWTGTTPAVLGDLPW